MPDGVSSPADPDRLHHSRVPQLSTAEVSVEHHWLLELVRLDASDEEGIALTEGGHQHLKTPLELRGQSGSPLPGLGTHGKIAGEDLLEELVLGHVDQLQQVPAESVSEIENRN